MIEQLQLWNFRNYQEKSFTLAPVTAITGPNGAGKTTILEAISLLSLTTSWKTEKDTEVIRWGQSFARIVSGDMEMVIQTHPYLKRLRIDGVSKRAGQVIGSLPSVLFQPDDLQLLYGAPSYRRQYLDRLISQTLPPYTQAVLQLMKVLKQRNRLLKNIQEGLAGEAELVFWDQELAELQAIIQPARAECIEGLSEAIPQLFKEMVPQGGVINLHYLKSPLGSAHSFMDHLQENRHKEIAAGGSLYGPHREDLEVRWGEHLAAQAMSRGQARALLVAFKIAELHFILKKNQHRPVLLLDDIFSELDRERRERLVGVFGDYQVIMTTTELGSLQGLLPPSTQQIELS